ncbi:hypothetical protein L1987_63715 [Smallanthus sonchifolius]|uniref:Uncharacterized protein n=1 Tax=Smallanthus sonchifolius TaxID=185202 RepID=A0ACB9CE43_9ASTR|nr:hypothetical protein L1987_63715 [Smallanthus sonchifolius]
MKNKHPKVKPSDGDWNIAKNKQKVFHENKQCEKPKVGTPQATKKFVKPTPIWKTKSKAVESPILDNDKDMCLQKVSYIEALGVLRTTMAWALLKLKGQHDSVSLKLKDHCHSGEYLID